MGTEGKGQIEKAGGKDLVSTTTFFFIHGRRRFSIIIMMTTTTNSSEIASGNESRQRQPLHAFLMAE